VYVEYTWSLVETRGSVKYSKCEAEWPSVLRLDPEVQVIPAIPKLHEPAHKEIHNELSMNHVVGVGLIDGECIERIWARHNALGNLTKTMGPSARHDTLDDHFGFWNWLKWHPHAEVQGGNSAPKCTMKAVEWEAMCVAWETDPSYPRNAKSPLISDIAFLKQRSERNWQRQRRNVCWAEEPLCMQLPHTSTQDASLSEQQNALRTKVWSWEQLRGMYMPDLLQFLHDRACAGGLEADTEEQPESADLWLPSQLPPEKRCVVCTLGLPEMEAKLRLAQLPDSLEGIWHVLPLKTWMIQFKNANRDSTQSRTVISMVHEMARASAAKYRNARERHLALVGPGEWERNLRLLLDADIWGYTDPSRVQGGTIEDEVVVLPEVFGEEGDSEGESNGEGEGGMEAEGGGISFLPEVQAYCHGTGAMQRELSWIWTTGRDSSSVDDEELLRSEWARSRAHVNRATEEVLLLREEMGWALEFLKWKGNWWREHISFRPVADKELAEGLQAYAQDQVSLQERLALSFWRIFTGPLEEGIQELQKRLAVMVAGAEDEDKEDKEGDEEDADAENFEDEGEGEEGGRY
ncbi:hypothetical protein DXG01_005951, partial [Tephrocybe rancida]